MAKAREIAADAPRPQRLLYQVKRLYSALRTRLEAITREHDLTAGDYTMLSFLRRYEPCSAADLARLQGTTPQAATQQVAQLEAKRMVTREPNAANRRISLIRMTGTGRTCLEAISREAAALEAELVVGLSAEQHETILDFLARATETAANGEGRG